jgi:hypothetical protein
MEVDRGSRIIFSWQLELELKKARIKSVPLSLEYCDSVYKYHHLIGGFRLSGLGFFE